MNRVKISDLIQGNQTCGTFLAFHLVNNTSIFKSFKTSLIDRGYLSFRRTHDIPALRTYVHGDIKHVGYDLDCSNLRFIRSRKYLDSYYKPQINFSDCKSFDLLVANPLAQVLKVKIEYFDSVNNVISRETFKIEKLGCRIIPIQNHEGRIYFIKVISRLDQLRPLIFKYNSSHVDVLHS